MARPFLPVDNVAVFDVLQELDGVPYCNSFHWWLFGDVWDVLNLEEHAIGMQAWFVDLMLPVLGDDVLYTGIKCRDLTTSSGATFNLVAAPLNGSYGSPSIPLNCAVYIKTRTRLLPTRHTFYNVIGGIPASEVVGDYVNQSYLDDLFDAYIEFQDVFTGLDVAAVNVSYITGNSYRSAGAIYGLGRTFRPGRKLGTRARRARNL